MSVGFSDQAVQLSRAAAGFSVKSVSLLFSPRRFQLTSKRSGDKAQCHNKITLHLAFLFSRTLSMPSRILVVRGHGLLQRYCWPVRFSPPERCDTASGPSMWTMLRYGVRPIDVDDAVLCLVLPLH